MINHKGVCGVLVLIGGAMLVGCGETPFKPDMPRTPYSRYQALRGTEPPQEELDTFGNAQPALRARLEPRDRP